MPLTFTGVAIEPKGDTLVLTVELYKVNIINLHLLLGWLYVKIVKPLTVFVSGIICSTLFSLLFIMIQNYKVKAIDCLLLCFSNLNSNLTWKLLGHLTGGGTETKNKLIPPQGYRELLIVSSCTGVNTMTIHVPAGTSGWFSGSYYITGTDNAFFRVGVQETAIWLGIAYQNSGTNVTDATQLDVYYK